ncbi:MAG: hypothetical protein AAFU77_04240 [Myxococcota bacterium]
MSDTRSCARCGGEEFQMRSETGSLIEWQDTSGKRETWFCPNCDWGQDDNRATSER